MMASHRLHRMLLADVVMCLSSLRRQQLLAAACLRVRDNATREDAGDNEDGNGHKHKRTRCSYECTGYYIAVPAVGPCLDAPAD